MVGDNNTFSRTLLVSPQAAIKLRALEIVNTATGLLSGREPTDEECEIINRQGIIQRRKNNGWSLEVRV